MKVINYRVQIPLTNDQYFYLIGSDTGDFKSTIRSLGVTDLSVDIFGGIVFNTSDLLNATRVQNFVNSVLNSYEDS